MKLIPDGQNCNRLVNEANETIPTENLGIVILAVFWHENEQQMKGLIIVVIPRKKLIEVILTQYTVKEISYILGQQIGQGFLQQRIAVDADEFCESIRGALKGEEPKLSVAEMNQKLEQFQNDIAQREEANRQAAAAENKQKGLEYLEGKAKESGVQKTASGLLYEVLVEGSGEKPTLEQTVTTHYEGTLIDGNIFDSSVKRGQPASFPVGGVIQGWQEALQLMTVGSKWRLHVPPELAYGATGSPPVIGPDETLIFEVELISIG